MQPVLALRGSLLSWFHLQRCQNDLARLGSLPELPPDIVQVSQLSKGPDLSSLSHERQVICLHVKQQRGACPTRTARVSVVQTQTT